MEPPNAEELLFRDASGAPAQVQDIIDEGLDGAYRERIPELASLLWNGEPYHRLLAAAMLTSWGVGAGFSALTTWAQRPDQAPWAGEAVTTDRLTGADSAFETLADAVLTSFWNDRSPELRQHQTEALRALLNAAQSRYVGRSLALATLRDRELTSELLPDLRRAAEAALQQLERGNDEGFDRAFQTAALLAPVAREDDAAAASYARRLLTLAPDRPRTVREIALALAEGGGPDTLAVLQQLRQTAPAAARRDIEEALARRTSEG